MKTGLTNKKTSWFVQRNVVIHLAHKEKEVRMNRYLLETRMCIALYDELLCSLITRMTRTNHGAFPTIKLRPLWHLDYWCLATNDKFCWGLEYPQLIPNMSVKSSAEECCKAWPSLWRGVIASQHVCEHWKQIRRYDIEWIECLRACFFVECLIMYVGVI